MISIYDKRGLQTAESQEFGIKVGKAIRPILEEYFYKGFSMRDLAHEAQAVVRDWELDHMMEIHMEDAKKARESLKNKRIAKRP